MTEQDYDQLLNIKTAGSRIVPLPASLHYNPYEPTPYQALDTYFHAHPLTSNDRLVDFGSGKGRLSFYVHYYFNAATVGVEMHPDFHQQAIENLSRYMDKRKKGKHKLHFCHSLAEDYKIDPDDNRFYFFNPFSVQIFISIVNNILRSKEAHERDIELILYYATEEYIYFLEHETTFELIDTVTVPDVYPENPYERLFLYKLAY